MAADSALPSPPTASAAFLRPIGLHDGGPLIPLKRPVLLIGAQANCHLHLISDSISRVHAVVLTSTSGEVLIRDLASRTHVLVNGQKSREALLRHSDVIRLGDFEFQFHAASHDQPSEPAPRASLQIEGVPHPAALNQRVLLLGRRTGSDILFQDLEVSTSHAILFALDGAHFIRDLGSRTGTFVNGRRDKQFRLLTGDKIRVGTMTLTYVQSPNDDEVAELEAGLAPSPSIDDTPEPPLTTAPPVRDRMAQRMERMAARADAPAPLPLAPAPAAPPTPAPTAPLPPPPAAPAAVAAPPTETLAPTPTPPVAPVLPVQEEILPPTQPTNESALSLELELSDDAPAAPALAPPTKAPPVEEIVAPTEPTHESALSLETDLPIEPPQPAAAAEPLAPPTAAPDITATPIQETVAPTEPTHESALSLETDLPTEPPAAPPAIEPVATAPEITAPPLQENVAPTQPIHESALSLEADLPVEPPQPAAAIEEFTGPSAIAPEAPPPAPAPLEAAAPHEEPHPSTASLSGGLTLLDDVGFLGGMFLDLQEPLPPEEFGKVAVDFNLPDPTPQAASTIPAGQGPYDQVRVLDEPGLGMIERPKEYEPDGSEAPLVLTPTSQLYPKPPPAARRQPVRHAEVEAVLQSPFTTPLVNSASAPAPLAPTLGQPANALTAPVVLLATDVFSGPLAGASSDPVFIPPAGTEETVVEDEDLAPAFGALPGSGGADAARTVPVTVPVTVQLGAAAAPPAAKPAPAPRAPSGRMLIFFLTASALAAAVVTIALPRRHAVVAHLTFQNLATLSPEAQQTFTRDQERLLNEPATAALAADDLRQHGINPGFLASPIAPVSFALGVRWDDAGALILSRSSFDDDDARRLDALVAALSHRDAQLAQDAHAADDDTRMLRQSLRATQMELDALTSRRDKARGALPPGPDVNRSTTLHAAADRSLAAWRKAQDAVADVQSRFAAASRAVPAELHTPAPDTQALEARLTALQQQLQTLRTQPDASAAQARAALDLALARLDQDAADAQSLPGLADQSQAAQALTRAVRDAAAPATVTARPAILAAAMLSPTTAPSASRASAGWTTDIELQRLIDDMALRQRGYNAAVAQGYDTEAARLKTQIDLANREIAAHQYRLDPPTDAGVSPALSPAAQRVQDARADLALASAQAHDLNPSAQDVLARIGGHAAAVELARAQYESVRPQDNSAPAAQLQDQIAQITQDLQQRRSAATQPAGSPPSALLASLRADLGAANTAEKDAARQYLGDHQALLALLAEQDRLNVSRGQLADMDQEISARSAERAQLQTRLGAQVQVALTSVYPLTPHGRAQIVTLEDHRELYLAAVILAVAIVLGIILAALHARDHRRARKTSDSDLGAPPLALA